MIFVTGAGGNVGRELVKKLFAAGVKFRAGYYSKAKAEQAKQTGIDAVAVDFANVETLRVALQGVDKAVLISGNVPNQSELELNVVREAKKAGIQTSASGEENRGVRHSLHIPAPERVYAEPIQFRCADDQDTGRFLRSGTKCPDQPY